jgi:catechol 2,3-dioxygenase-like lactoylglutathione lyase family enzyme
MIQIKLVSIMVDDQDRALKFYTQVMGFEKRVEFPAGEYRWITVGVVGDPDGVQLSLEPNANPVGRTFQEGLFTQGIPYTAFQVDDLAAEHARLAALGVVFTTPPTDPAQGMALAVFQDTCGNLIQLYQLPG